MAERISASEVRRHMDAGEDVLLVCAYEDDEKCRQTGVDESMTYGEFQRKLPNLSKSVELVFFCA